MPKTIALKDENAMNDLLKQKELSVAQAALVLGLSRQTVYKLIEENALSVSRRKTATMGIYVSTISVLNYARNVQLRTFPSKTS